MITPALEDPIEGAVYLATPYDNPFDSLLAGYIVFTEPGRGILIKLPGRIELDKDTGQITGTFEDNPQLPFSEFELRLQGRRPLLADHPEDLRLDPSQPGNQPFTSNATFAPWSGNPAAQVSDSFTITQAPGGGACAGSEAEMPNSPSFDAGPVSPISKNYSPFVVHLRREDGSQRFSALNLIPAAGADRQAGRHRALPRRSVESGGVKERQSRAGLPLLSA